MHYAGRRFFVLLLVVVIFAGAVSLSAEAFDYAPEEVRNADEILKNAQFSLLEAPPRKYGIECFDVSPEGLIAIGTQKGETKIVSVCDQSGAYLYGFTYRDSGTFGLGWQGDHVLVYSVRSDLAFRVSPTGEVVEIREIKSSPENNDYWNHTVFAPDREVGACRYCLRSDMGILNFLGSSYSQLVAVCEDGEEQILYDVNSELLTTTVLLLAGVVLFIGIVLWMLYHQFRKMGLFKNR